MSAAANKLLVQKVFAGLAQGDPRFFVDSMDEKFRWRISGDSPWSKTFEGKQAVLGQLFVLLRDRIADRPRTIAHRFIAEDDLVVVEAIGNNVSKTGAVYDNSYCFVIRVSDGKLQEITEYCDTDLAVNALGAPPV